LVFPNYQNAIAAGPAGAFPASAAHDPPSAPMATDPFPALPPVQPLKAHSPPLAPVPTAMPTLPD